MTTARFGDRASFAVEVGGVATPGLRVVDLWLAGKRLTVKDNAAYAPSLSFYMRRDAHRVRESDIPPRPSPSRDPAEIYRLLQADERFWFMRWTEIVDNVSAYAYLDEDLVILFSLRREDHEEQGEARLPPKRFLAIVEEAAGMLEAGS